MELRTDLLPLPARIAQLHVRRGYPVPWFVAWLDDQGAATPRGVGKPDFRILFPGATTDAHKFGLCWICGQRLGRHRAFVVGPMCAVNRTSAEPPSHVECAEWSVRACPFMLRPHMQRREAGLPDGTIKPPGIMLIRNPGVMLIWTTERYGLKRAPNGGMLFDMGEPAAVAFYTEGRQATREEIEASIDSGLPALREIANLQGAKAITMLDKWVSQAMDLLPAREAIS